MSKEKSPAYKFPNASFLVDAKEAIIWGHTKSMEEIGRAHRQVCLAVLEGRFEDALAYPWVLRIIVRKGRSSICRKIKQEILNIGRCQHCGCVDNLQVDHIYPVSLGGSNQKTNLQCLCRSCNRKKSNKIEEKIKKQKKGCEVKPCFDQ